MAITQVGVGTAANDGTGETLRAAFQRHNTNTLATAEVFNTVVELRAGALLGANRLAFTLGNVSVGDGMGGGYYYSTASSTADDGYAVIKPDSIAGASPGRWLKWL